MLPYVDFEQLTMPAVPPLRVAIIGCGRMGRVHAARIAGDARAEIAAVFDVDASMAEAMQDVAPEARRFDDLDRMLDESSLDAAVIATPTALHFEQILACRDNGLHVLCEKPLADTRDRIVDLVDRSHTGPELMVGYQRRFWATYRTILAEIQSGESGRVRAISFHSVENWQQSIAGTWRDDPVVNWGGFVGDAGSHKIDAVQFLVGLRPVEVFARIDDCGSRVPITAGVTALLEGDVPVTMDFVGHGQYRGEDLTVHCESADWMLRGTVPAGQEVWVGREETMERVDDLQPGTDPTIGFLDVVTGAIENPAPASCALPVYDFTAAILESARIGESVRLER